MVVRRIRCVTPSNPFSVGDDLFCAEAEADFAALIGYIAERNPVAATGIHSSKQPTYGYEREGDRDVVAALYRERQIHSVHQVRAPRSALRAPRPRTYGLASSLIGAPSGGTTVNVFHILDSDGE
jgi:hypothetical protein